MMNKLTIKLAARQAQALTWAFSHSFMEAQKKKPDEGIPSQDSQVISGNFHGASWISGEKRVEKEAPCIY